MAIDDQTLAEFLQLVRAWSMILALIASNFTPKMLPTGTASDVLSGAFVRQFAADKFEKFGDSPLNPYQEIRLKVVEDGIFDVFFPALS